MFCSQEIARLQHTGLSLSKGETTLKFSENKIVTLSYLKVFGLFGSHNFLLFSSRLKQKQAVFYPNQSKKEQSGSKAERNDLILSNQILDAAKVNAQNFQESMLNIISLFCD